MAETGITVKITGAESLRKRLKANNLMMTPLRNYLNGYGKVIKEKSKVHAPVDTGALRRSIKYTRVKSQGRIPNNMKVFATAKHASFVHGNPEKDLECLNHSTEQDHTSHQSKHLLGGQRDMA